MSHSWCLPDVFTVRLIMESDWHVGSGTGRPGNIDRLVTRDADGLPYVPAKTLHGIWRDACERLCQVLDRPQPSGWINWVNYLFGSQPALGKGDPTGRHKDPTRSPIPAALQVRAAYIPDSLRRLLAGQDRRRLQSVLTIIKPGVKIDRRSGTAQTDFLRFEEMGRKGTILEATCRLDGQFSPELREAASAILIASTKLMERLGGKRRRGAGKCRVEIVGADLDAAIKWLKENAQPPTPTIESRRQDSDLALGTVQGTANDKWLVVPLRLHLQSPVAVSVRFTGNVVESLDYIPGTYLLPHITAVFPELRPGVLASEVIVTPAYPEVDGEPSLPAPFCIHVTKGQRK
ncbi:MAG: hypothetical protein KatS3mg110_0503 [Pirellulaceae bacterium]|nr:MAG: hypothetical protein KatS3mg110_0503 [Pirellulaceae bacterium]